MPTRECFRINRCKGDDLIRAVAYVRGSYGAERQVEAYDAGRTDEEIKAGIYYASEKVAQSLCTGALDIIVPPGTRHRYGL